MKKRNTITILFTLAVIVAAMTVIGAQRTQGQVVKLTGENHSIVGFAPGQTLRFNVLNSNTLAQGSEPVSATTYIYDSTGRLLAQSPETTIAAGQFHSFDFNRDTISAEGEVGTRRLQVRGTIQVSFMDGSVKNLSQSFPISMEVIENSNGTNTGTYSTGYVKVSDDGPGD